MGEIAEMMLEGLLDEETGELIDGEAPGYPRRMSAGNAPRSDAEQAARREKNRRKRARQKVKRERLAAAAPDLLRCLKLVEAVYRLNCVAPGEPSSVLADMQATIAKAEG